MSLIKETVAGGPFAADLSWSAWPSHIHEMRGTPTLEVPRWGQVILGSYQKSLRKSLNFFRPQFLICKMRIMTIGNSSSCWEDSLVEPRRPNGLKLPKYETILRPIQTPCEMCCILNLKRKFPSRGVLRGGRLKVTWRNLMRRVVDRSEELSRSLRIC